MGRTIVDTDYLWRCAGASVIGTQHEQAGGRCEDAWSHSRRSNMVASVLGICISDGAGSACRGWAGAEATTKLLSRWLVDNFDQVFTEDEQKVRRKVWATVIRALRKMADRSELSLQDYACTLVATAVSQDGRWVVFHLGDGGVVGMFGEQLTIISQPQKGEHVNETFFITDEDAIASMLIARGDPATTDTRLRAIALFTDGIEGCIVNRHTNQVAPAMAQMFAWLHCQPEPQVCEAIFQNLKEVFRGRSGDDCTLVICTHREYPATDRTKEQNHVPSE